VQRVESLQPDCDGDVVLARVRTSGPACHDGTSTCFGAGTSDAIGTLDATIARIATRVGTEGGSVLASTHATTGYTARLLADRNLRLKKLGEEAVELATACADGDAGRATEEAADLLYHALVALRAAGGSLDGLRAALDRRAAERRAVAPG
jgi:phosphoribosyl-ATP pyrophosphohydrolase/phosphoribosyl-AMP cyclohydrolase